MEGGNVFLPVQVQRTCPLPHYGMEIKAEKTKLMTNNTSGINTEIKVNGQKLETVTSPSTWVSYN